LRHFFHYCFVLRGLLASRRFAIERSVTVSLMCMAVPQRGRSRSQGRAWHRTAISLAAHPLTAHPTSAQPSGPAHEQLPLPFVSLRPSEPLVPVRYHEKQLPCLVVCHAISKVTRDAGPFLP
jgi:hypothetical protein